MGFDAPLTGRDAILSMLDAAVDATAAGRGETVMLAGEPGIGKTALLTAVARNAEAKGAAVWWGRCWEGPSVPAYWPWTQVLRAATSPSSSGEEQLGAAVPLVAEAAGGGPVATSADEAEAARFALFDAVVRFLAARADQNPVVVILDDLQWADESSLLLLEFAAHQLQARPVLLLGAYRDAEAGPKLRRATAHGRVLGLGGLSRDEVAALMATLSETPPSERFVAEVQRRTGGNPLFVRELSRLSAAGDCTAGGERTGPVVPDSIRETLERRLARLSQPCANLLAVAAIAGSEPRLEVLVRVTEDEIDLLGLLEEAVQARVLLPPDEPLGPYRFSHELYRDTILAGLPTAARMRLHRTVARGLEALRDEGTAISSAELAGHFLAALPLEDPAVIRAAVRHCAQAGSEATAQLAYAEACAHYDRALRALEHTGQLQSSARLELLLELGGARDRAGQAAAARDTYHQAASLARHLDDALGLARAAIGMHRLGAPAGASHHHNIALLEEAGGALGDEPKSLRAQVLASLARDLHHSWEEHNVERAELIAERAVAVARDLDDPATSAFCLLALHDASWRPGTAQDRLEIANDMLAAATRGRDGALVAQATLLRATALIELGDPHGRTELQRYCQLAEDLGHARGRWGAASRRAVLALLDGQTDGAAALAEEAARMGQEIGEADALAVYDTLLWEIARFRGGRGGHTHPPAPLPVAEHAPWRAIRFAEDGNHEAAQAVLESFDLTVSFRPGVPASPDPWPLVVSAEAVAAAGAPEQQQAMYERLQPLAGTHVVVGGCAAYAGAVDHYLGRLAASLGRHDDAIQHFVAAQAMHHRLGAPLWAELDRDETSRLQKHEHQPAANVFRRDGDIWTLTYQGRTIRLPDTKGLRDLAILLSYPGRPLAAQQLRTPEVPVATTGSDPVLDHRARLAYRQRLAELESEIDTADANHDLHRAERARLEREALIAELSKAVGLAGRPRRLGHEGERARKAVTARIRRAIQQIRDQHPDLANHLETAIRTGSTCAYQPATQTRWSV